MSKVKTILYALCIKHKKKNNITQHTYILCMLCYVNMFFKGQKYVQRSKVCSKVKSAFKVHYRVNLSFLSKTEFSDIEFFTDKHCDLL